MPFEPGQSGNPGGQSKSAKIFKDALRLAINRTEGDKTKLALIAEAMIDKAQAGDVQAFNAIADRIDGKPTQLIGGDEESSPILHRLVREIVDPKNAADTDSEGVPAAT